MKNFMKTKAGVVLVGFSVLAVWMLLVAQPATAHQYNSASTPSCSSLPTADGFFGTANSPEATHSIIGSTSSSFSNSSVSTKPGATDANSGNTKYRYAKITIPALAAGELRVFDSRSSGGTDVSSAALCRRGSRIASFNKSYSSSKHPSATPDHSDDRAEHEVFQIRVSVSPGDEEYIVVIDSEETPATGVQATTPGTIAVAFHGAIESTSLGRQTSLDQGEVESRTIVITAPGLLTLETTGSTDTVGTFGDGSEVESGGSGGNFKMVLPVEADAAGETLLVEGQTPTTEGSYTLNMDFEVAMSTTATEITVEDAPAWTDTPIADDDTTLQIDGSSDADYFVFSSSANGFLTVEATDDAGATKHSDTAGTLYGPDGQIATASSGGGGNHFKFRVPVDNMHYAVKVTGTTGQYDLSFAFDATTDQDTSESSALPSDAADCPTADSFSGYTNLSHQICRRGDRLQQERDRYLIDIMESGTLYVHSTGSIDTVGTLYGPDGGQLATDDNDGADNNFRIARSVNPGLHIVEVRGQNPNTQGAYGLVTNFVTGATPVDPTDPTGPTDPPPTTTDPDPTGNLEEPPNGGTRGGIGLVRGWVCQDDGNGVEIRISNSAGTRVATFTAPYGSERDDVERAGACDRRGNTFGFAAQFNYNNLSAGRYRVEAWVGGEQVGPDDNGQTNMFTVARIPGDGFLERDPPNGRVLVEDFPVRGTTTILQWDRSSQNFEIVGTQ